MCVGGGEGSVDVCVGGGGGCVWVSGGGRPEGYSALIICITFLLLFFCA